MIYQAIDLALWVAAALVWWLAPESWRPLFYVLIGASVVVALLSYLASRKRIAAARVRVEESKRKLDEIQRKLDEP